jgi:polysaccharide biosynthesis protein PslE
MIVQTTLPNIVYVLFRHKWLMLWTFCIGVGLVVIYSVVATPLYQAEADLYVKFGRDASSGVNISSGAGQASASADQENVLNSLIQLLTSDQLVGDVIQEIGLAKLYPAIAAKPPWVGTALGAAVRKMTRHGLTVKTVPNSNVIQLLYNHPDPLLAAKAVNLLVDKFTERELRLLRDPQSTFLQDQLDQFRGALRQAETALEQFRKQTGISSLDEERTLLLKQRADVESNADGNQAQVAELEQRRQTLQTELKSLPVNLKLSDDDINAQSQLLQLRVQRQMLLNNYRADSKSVINVEQQIAVLDRMAAQGATKLQRQMPSTSYQEIEVDLNRVSAQIAGLIGGQRTLETQHSDLDRRIAALDANDRKLKDLMRLYQIADLNYRTYFQNVQDARIADDLNKQKITTISEIQAADAPDIATYPKTMLLLVLGTVLSTLLALVIAFVREAFEERLNQPMQVERTLGIPVLASLPRVGRSELSPIA